MKEKADYLSTSFIYAQIPVPWPSSFFHAYTDISISTQKIKSHYLRFSTAHWKLVSERKLGPLLNYNILSLLLHFCLKKRKNNFTSEPFRKCRFCFSLCFLSMKTEVQIWEIIVLIYSFLIKKTSLSRQRQYQLTEKL